MSIPYLFGIRMEDGSLRVTILPSLNGRHVSALHRELAKLYPTRSKVLNFLKRQCGDNEIYFQLGRKSSIPPSVGCEFKADDIFQLRQLALEKQWEVEHLYIWVQVDKTTGFWVYTKINEPENRLSYVRFDPVNDRLVVEEQEWLATYLFPHSPSQEPSLPPVAYKRLSKEDWLAQNYPGMTELPKWRFPASL
jgi:hypothetical protein